MQWYRLDVMKVILANTAVLLGAIFCTSIIVIAVKMIQPSIGFRVAAAVLCAYLLSMGLAFCSSFWLH